RGPQCSKHLFALGQIIVAAAVERRGAVFITVRETIRICEIGDAVSQIDLRVEETTRLAFIAHAARCLIFDLHQTEAMMMDKARIVAAFAQHGAMDERHWNAMYLGLR